MTKPRKNKIWRVAGKFKGRYVAMANLYTSAPTLYWQEVDETIAWLKKFKSWAKAEQAKRAKTP